MKLFSEYLQSIKSEHATALSRVIEIVHAQAPDAVEGLSYGLPAFKFNDRPLIGFSSNKHGLNIYPFDPRIIDQVRPQLADFEVSKGVIRFTPDHELSEEIVILLTNLRLDYLKNSK